ncbi:MAG: hypothetical protein WCT39_01805, partial [Candidatus Margulisiibacteriota bacterium]
MTTIQRQRPTQFLGLDRQLSCRAAGFSKKLNGFFHQILANHLVVLIEPHIAGKNEETEFVIKLRVIDEQKPKVVAALNRLTELYNEKITQDTNILQFFRQLGFQITIKDSNKNNIELIIELATPEMSNPLTEFARDPSNEAAEALWADHSESVTHILAYEADNPQPDFTVLKIGTIFFKRKGCWENLVKVGEKLLSIPAKQRGTIPQLYLAKAYCQLGNCPKTLELLEKFDNSDFSSLSQEQLYEFLDIYTFSMIQQLKFDQLIKFLEGFQFYKGNNLHDLLLYAKLSKNFVHSTTETEAQQLVKECEQTRDDLAKMCQNELFALGYVWTLICAGNAPAARQQFDTFLKPPDDLTSKFGFMWAALSAALDEKQGAVEKARETAVNALKNLEELTVSDKSLADHLRQQKSMVSEITRISKLDSRPASNEAIPSELSEKEKAGLERLKANPQDYDLAKQLAASCYEQVAQIYFNLSGKTVYVLNALSVGARIFNEKMDWKKTIILLEKERQVSEFLASSKPKEKKLSAINLANNFYYIRIAQCYAYLCDIESARSAIKKVAINYLDKESLGNYCNLLLDFAKLTGDYDSAITAFQNLSGLIRKSYKKTVYFYELCAVLYRGCVSLPSREEARTHAAAYEVFEGENFTFDPVHSIWLFLCAGQVEKARNFIEKLKPSKE